MNETITIEEKILNDIKNSFEKEVNEFSTKNNKKNNNYIFSCSDPVIKEMSSNLKTLYSDIDKSYKTMNDWLKDYKKNYDQLEKSLASGSNTASDSNIRNYLQQFISKINGTVKKVTKSFDGIKAVDIKVMSGATSPSEFKEIDEKNLEIDELKNLKESRYKSLEDIDKDELKNLKESLDKSLEDIDKTIDPIQIDLQKKYEERKNLIDIYGSDDKQNLEEINKEIEELEIQINNLKGVKQEFQIQKKSLENAIDLYPYEENRSSEEFKEFINNYNSNYQNLNYELLTALDYDISKYKEQMLENITDFEQRTEIDQLALVEYIIENNQGASIEELELQYPVLTNSWTNYKYMSEEQKQMYHYLFNKEGEGKATEYLSLIQDSINQAEGAAKAAEFIEKLDLTNKEKLETSLGNIFDVGTKGLTDGISSFVDGFENLLTNNDQISATDYERMIILQYLQENSNYFDEEYQFSSSLGNILPSIVTSAIVSFIATPAAGGAVANSLMGLSSWGNAKHQALVDGSSILQAQLYGLFTGLSEAAFERFIGNIPGLSKEAAFTVKGILSEGTEEFAQEWVDAGLRAVILGEDVNWLDVPEDATYSFIMGVLMSTVLTGSQEAIKFTINGITKEINLKEIQKFIDEHPDMAIEDIFREAGIIPNTVLNYSETDFSNMYDNDIQSLRKYLKDAGLENYQIDKIINNKNYAIATAMQVEKYLHGETNMPNYILENKISNSKYQRVVDGITFVSDSAEGLDRLIHYYNDSKNNSSSKYFFKKLERNHRNELIITNIDSFVSYYNQDIIINITNEKIDNSIYETLYHELGHYLDVNNKSKLFRRKYVYDPLEPYIQQDYKQIEAGLNKLKYDYNNEVNKFQDYYLNDSVGKKELDEMAYKKMDEKYGTIWRTDSNYKAALTTVKTEVYWALMDNYMRQNGYCSIIDIMSAVGLPIVDENGNSIYSHSSSYYDTNAKFIDDWGKSSDSLPRAEIIAELNALYLTGNFDKLYDYFPKDLVDKWRIGIVKVNGTKGR